MQLLLANGRLLRYLFVIAAVCGLGWYIYQTGYDNGVTDTVAEYQLRIEEERNRVSDANKLALEQAEKRQAILLKSIRARNDEIAKLQLEAEQDPSGNDPSISVDGVRRINRVR